MLLPANNQPLRTPPAGPLRFGAGALPLDWVTQGVNKLFSTIQANRSREMIVEDLGGFGVLRTGMDLQRGKIYGGDYNWAAGAERLARETASILTDNVAGGLIGFLVGALALRVGGKQWGNQFTDYNTLNLFRDIVREPGALPSSLQFLSALAGKIARQPGQQAAIAQALQAFCQAGETVTVNGLQAKAGAVKTNWPALAEQQALKLAKNHLQQETLSVQIGKQSFQLHDLFDDARLFTTQMGRVTEEAAKNGAKKAPWRSLAESALKNTLKTKNIKLAAGLGAAMLATFGVPFLIANVTRKRYGIDYYPGEIGLRAGTSAPAGAQARKSFWEEHCPYITQAIRNGNVWPALIALIPLPFAAGIVDVDQRQWVLSFKKWLKRAPQMFDFSKKLPFTGTQQMAAGFAVLITARLLGSRSDNEFRERLIDSFAGWGLWIFGTPLLKKGIAWLSDRSGKTQLLKDGALRSRAEIETLLTRATPQILKNTRRANIWIGAGSTALSMLMLGIIEPWLGIKWTQRHEQQKARKAVAQTPPSLRPAMPATLSSPLNNRFAFAATRPIYAAYPAGASPFSAAYAPFPANTLTAR